MKFLDYLVYLLVRCAFFLIGTLPHRVAMTLLTVIARTILFFMPRYKRIAMKNLAQAFPEKSPEWRERVYYESITSLARLVYDFSRFHKLPESWFAEHVVCPNSAEIAAMLKSSDRKPPLFVTGHLGSFELLARIVNNLGYPNSFIVRNFKNKFIDNWWNKRREAHGNLAINRKGAMKQVLRTMQSDRAAAILFDQNITRNNAVFVDLFGRQAATTKAVGMAAARMEASVHLISLAHLGDDRYRVDWVIADMNDIYTNESLSSDDKVQQITQRASKIYENMIRNNPGGWFWIHRRWKTAPEGVPEDFYADC